MANTNLHKAKNAKNDEFYTRFTDVEKLQAENAELKELLKLAIEGFAIVGQYDVGCSAEDDCEKCPFNLAEEERCLNHWRYESKVKELLKNGTVRA